MDSKQDSRQLLPADLELQQVPAFSISALNTPVEASCSEAHLQSSPAEDQIQMQEPQVTVHTGGYQPIPACIQLGTSIDTVVTTQPSVQQEQHDGPTKPDNYRTLAIFSMICCCHVFGLISLIYSIKVDSAYNRQDYEEADKASKIAKLWGRVALAVGIITWIFVGVSAIVGLIHPLGNID